MEAGQARACQTDAVATIRSEDLAAFSEGDGLRRLREVLERPAIVLDQIGALIVKESGKAFRDERLGGVAWKPRRVPNVPGILKDAAMNASKPPDRRFKARPVLIDTGLLARSVTHHMAGPDVVEVCVGGVAKTYADVHQIGGASQTVPITEQVQNRLWAWIKSATGLGKIIRKNKIRVAKQKALKGEGGRMDAQLKRLNRELRKAKTQMKRERKAFNRATSGISKEAREHLKEKDHGLLLAQNVVGAAKQDVRERRKAIGKDIDAATPRDKSIAWGGKEQKERAASGLEGMRWLLNPNLRGKRLSVKVPARPFVGLPPDLVREIERTLGVSVRVA